ncbi:sterol desaturase family protein [Bradyrhizobium erythrophlei]|uniref:sterol desaturase family protein n=1 Tax=Bradyrhizobium erythrophlei TaxID=1437360 RepID=UPI0035ECEC32
MDILGLKGILISFLVFVPLERLFALRKEQKIFRRQWANDLLFLFLNGLLVRLGLIALIVTVVYLAGQLVPSSASDSVAALPLWIQIPTVILVADLGFYWTHRMFHAVPWLWRFHAIHHSIEELDWLAGARIHPFDLILTRGVSLAPVFVLGFSETAVLVYAAIYGWQTMLIHSNVRLRFGPLRWVLASPEFHHWHHSKDAEARDKNFAAQLPLLDAMFGSLHMPRGRMPTAYGLDQPTPDRYVRQLIYPFTRQRDVPLVAPMEGGGQACRSLSAIPGNPRIDLKT